MNPRSIRPLVRLRLSTRLLMFWRFLKMAADMATRPLPPDMREGDTYTAQLSLSIHFEPNRARIHA